VAAEDKLFATLDPTTRQLLLPGNRKLLLTDTVGFIRRLPHALVEAFKATLEEVVVADFLIHVIDVSSADAEKHRATTLAVLGELGAAERPVLTAFNKTDLATPEQLDAARRMDPGGVFVSALTGGGLDVLVEHCRELAAGGFAATELLVPHDRYDVVARLHAFGQVHAQEHTADGMLIHGRFPPGQAGFFAPFVVRSRPGASAKKEDADGAGDGGGALAAG